MEQAITSEQKPSAPSLDVCFLDLARTAANSVGRVLGNDLEFKGTGFMISNRLFLTNNHVICNREDAMSSLVEFNHELNISGCSEPVTTFALAPNEFFLSSSREELDFTIVKVGNRISGTGKLSDFGYCSLKDVENIHRLGKFVNIIHYPMGSHKQIILSAPLSAFTDEVLHYYANTRTGSSGAPVLNEKAELIGVHHYRRPTRMSITPDGKPGPRDANEGIRIYAIVRRIRSEIDNLTPQQRNLVNDALN